MIQLLVSRGRGLKAKEWQFKSKSMCMHISKTVNDTPHNLLKRTIESKWGKLFTQDTKQQKRNRSAGKEG